MKALVVGPRLVDFDPGYNASVARALEELGYEVRVESFYVPTPPGLLNRLRIDLPMLLGHSKYYDAYVEDFNAQLLAQFKSLKPDIVLVIRGSKVNAETLQAMRNAVRVLWVHDRVARCEVSADQLRSYDHLFAFEGGDVPWLKESMGLDATFLPIGYDPTVYRPTNGTKRDIDLFFIGAYYPKRRAMLERLAHDFRGRKLRFYGRNVRYREPSTWLRAAGYVASYGATFVNRSLDAPAINGLYARAKICLNMHHDQSQLGCNPRVFEIMGAGAFQLVDAIPFVQQNLGEVLAQYTTYDELGAALDKYLANEEARQKLADEGRRLVLNEHTFGHRVRKILAATGLMRAAAS